MFSDFAFSVSKRMAQLFLRWSEYWGDIAEAIHTGQTRAEIKKHRELGDHDEHADPK